jgi:hypothetical protein
MNAITNAFSLNMVGNAMLLVQDCPADQVPADAVSYVGHESTATVLSLMLKREVKMNRVAISLDIGDCAYVATLFTKDGKPYRPPEGVVLGESDLAEVVIRFKRVLVWEHERPIRPVVN